MPACEYCGDHFPKGGAHATHERNCDARPQLDEKEDVQPDEIEQTDPEIKDDAPGDPDPPADANTIQMTDDELDKMLTSVDEEARASGIEEGIEQSYEAGLAEAQQDTSGRSSDTSSASTMSGDTCPDCGGTLEYRKAKTLFFATNGRVLTLESADGVCESCDIVVDDDGERIVGLPKAACDVVDRYIGHHRYDVYDDYGRKPLLTSQLGRGSTNAVRA